MRSFDRILAELGWPRIYLVSVEQFIQLEGWSPKEAWGGQGDKYPVICIVGKPYPKQRLNIQYHEILHHLFPHREEWWREAVAEKLARGGGRGEWCRESGHTLDDVPDRATLVKLCIRASERWNRKKRKQ